MAAAPATRRHGQQSRFSDAVCLAHRRRANQVLGVPLDPNVRTNCFGKTDLAGFTAALANELGLGFTFGGASFYGHGVYLSSGTATFTINSFTVD